MELSDDAGDALNFRLSLADQIISFFKQDHTLSECSNTHFIFMFIPISRDLKYLTNQQFHVVIAVKSPDIQTPDNLVNII